MIKKALVRGLALIFLCYVISVVATPVQAVELVLPFGMGIEGLTYSTPVALTVQETVNQPLSTLQITTTPELSVTDKPKSDSLADIIITPTPTPTATPTPTPTQPISTTMSDDITTSPTPTPTAIPTPTPQSSLSTGGGLNADVLFGMVNSYRASQNLPAFQQNPQVCAVAEARAPEVSNEVATGTMHAGLRAMNLPYWNSENIISMNSEQAAFNWWINDPIHHEAIVGNFTYSCLACSGDSCAEEFTNFQPK